MECCGGIGMHRCRQVMTVFGVALGACTMRRDRALSGLRDSRARELRAHPTHLLQAQRHDVAEWQAVRLRPPVGPHGGRQLRNQHAGGQQALDLASECGEGQGSNVITGKS